MICANCGKGLEATGKSVQSTVVHSESGMVACQPELLTEAVYPGSWAKVKK